MLIDLQWFADDDCNSDCDYCESDCSDCDYCESDCSDCDYCESDCSDCDYCESDCSDCDYCDYTCGCDDNSCGIDCGSDYYCGCDDSCDLTFECDTCPDCSSDCQDTCDISCDIQASSNEQVVVEETRSTGVNSIVIKKAAVKNNSSNTGNFSNWIENYNSASTSIDLFQRYLYNRLYISTATLILNGQDFSSYDLAIKLNVGMASNHQDCLDNAINYLIKYSPSSSCDGCGGYCGSYSVCDSCNDCSDSDCDDCGCDDSCDHCGCDDNSECRTDCLDCADCGCDDTGECIGDNGSCSDYDNDCTGDFNFDDDPTNDD